MSCRLNDERLTLPRAAESTRPPPCPTQRRARGDRHHGCQDVEQNVDEIEYAARQNQLDAFVEYSDQRRRQDGEQGGYADAATLARSLRERFIDEDGPAPMARMYASSRSS